MNEPDRKFWPYGRQTSMIWSIVIFLGLFFILLQLKIFDLWKISAESDTAVLIGIVIVSLLPIGLSVVDVIIERGGVIEYGGVKIDFTQVSATGVSGFAVPTNIGVPGQAITDSSTTEILEALSEATACEMVVIDLGDGQAWWETRLLVLLAGAARIGRPEKIVFVGNDGGVYGSFQGWGYSMKLLPYLLKAHTQYSRIYYAAQAAARQWELVEPVMLLNPNSPAVIPLQPPGMQPGLATKHPWMAFDPETGLPNHLFAEQLLASELGGTLETLEGPKPISLGRLRDIFHPVLYKDAIDITWPVDRQVAEFFDSKFNHVVITERGNYQSLTSRVSLLNEFVRRLTEKKIA